MTIPPSSSLLADRRHGIAKTYRVGCRCEECRAWARDYQRRYRAGIRPGNPKGLRIHGLNGYLRHRCRCDVCRAANTRSQRERRARKRAMAE